MNALESVQTDTKHERKLGFSSWTLAALPPIVVQYIKMMVVKGILGGKIIGTL